MEKEKNAIDWGTNTRRSGERLSSYLDRRELELFHTIVGGKDNPTVFDLQDFSAARRTLRVVWTSHSR